MHIGHRPELRDTFFCYLRTGLLRKHIQNFIKFEKSQNFRVHLRCSFS